MAQIKSGEEVSSFINSITGNVSKTVDIEPRVLNLIEENFSLFDKMGRTQEGCLDKLAFISAVLRTHQLTYISVQQRFSNTHIKSTSENFIFKIVAESYQNEEMPNRSLGIEKFARLKEKYLNSKNNMLHEEQFRIRKLTTQYGNIKSLLNSVTDIIGEESDSAIAITSYFLYEAEAMSNNQIENLLMFYDLFDMSNTEDKWFSCIDIEASYERINFVMK